MALDDAVYLVLECILYLVSSSWMVPKVHSCAHFQWCIPGLPVEDLLVFVSSLSQPATNCLVCLLQSLLMQSHPGVLTVWSLSIATSSWQHGIHGKSWVPAKHHIEGAQGCVSMWCDIVGVHYIIQVFRPATLPFRRQALQEVMHGLVEAFHHTIITSTSSLPQALSSLPKSRHTTSSGQVAKMLPILVLSGLYRILARVHLLHLTIQSWTEVRRPGQRDCSRINSSVHSAPWWPTPPWRLSRTCSCNSGGVSSCSWWFPASPKVAW